VRLFFFVRKLVDSKVAVVNDSPVGCQSRDPADPQIKETNFSFM
jgi:hypothetical protein